ncbi:MAG: hypothetical protein EHM87_25325 [Burkholderiales bacterium]|nr:MAG: hypothetical protein EHM87_25325 [Burkholderiales bacterium]
MKLICYRTSFYGGSGKPCEEAIFGEFIQTDQRTLKSFEKHDKKFKEKWTDKGENHRVTKHGIARDFSCYMWFVEISTLEELFKFIKKYDPVVLSHSHTFRDGSDEIMEIEIYDEYRE